MTAKTTSKGTTFTATLPNGETVTRTSKTKDYGFAVITVQPVGDLIASREASASEFVQRLRASGQNDRADQHIARVAAQSAEYRKAAEADGNVYGVYRWSERPDSAEKARREAEKLGVKAVVIPVN
jgi:hypothetical protein